MGISVLEHMGSKIKAFFVGANKIVIAADKEAIKLEPTIAALLPPSIAAMFTATANLIGVAEATGSAAAAGASGTGAAKSATVLAALQPIAAQVLHADGVSAPTASQLSDSIDLVVKYLKIFNVAEVAVTTK